MNTARFLTLLFSASMAGAASATTALNSDSLALTGQRQNGVVRYLGIPYAEATSGPGRWRAPRPLPDERVIRNLGTFGPNCAQPFIEAMGEQNVDPERTSEACLYLNVWAPEDAGETPYPVMVWLHGGGFRIGGSSLALYDGTELAREGAVVVTLNYRLGRLGFFAHQALSGEASGNLGLLDQIEALRFVRRHIEAFGGDANNVTLFGESAGGASVLYLMAARQARGLFDKAIVQSGAIDLPELGASTMEAIAHTFAANAGLSLPDADALRALPLETVLTTEPQGKTDTMPFIDGQLIERSLYQAFEQGDVAPVPLLIGSNDFEAGFFPPGFSLRVPEVLGPERWREAKRYTDGYGLAREQSDASIEARTYAQAAQIATDLFVTLGTRKVARDHARQGHPTYRYAFSYVAPQARERTLGAIHTADINYVFGNQLATDDQTQALSHELRRRWVAFAALGEPNAAGLSTWPAYQQADETLLHFTSGGTYADTDPNPDRLDYLESLGSLQIN